MVVILSEVLTFARTKKGLTQEALAEMIGVNKNRVGDWERSEGGRANILPKNVKKLCDLLRVQPEDLLESPPELAGTGYPSGEACNQTNEQILDGHIPKDFEWVLGIIGYPDETPPAKKANGVWEGPGGELTIQAERAAAVETRPLGFSFRLKQVGSRIVAVGADLDGDKVLFRGKMTDDGGYIFGTYRIFTRERELYGNATLSYDGDQMKGYYVGRDSDNNVGLAFGWMELNRKAKAT